MANTVTSKSDTAEFLKMLTPTELVRLHAPAVLAVCLVYTTNIHDAEDVMQSVFVKAFTKIKTLRDPQKIRPWLLQIARRMCVDLYRRRPPHQMDDIDKGRPGRITIRCLWPDCTPPWFVCPGNIEKPSRCITWTLEIAPPLLKL